MSTLRVGTRSFGWIFRLIAQKDMALQEELA